MRKFLPAAVAVSLALLGGFLLLRPQGGGGGEAQASAPPPEVQLTILAQETLRARLRQPDGLVFGTATVFRFGPTDERAVCGSVRQRGGPETPFILRILLPRDQAVPDSRRAVAVMEQGPGLTHAAGDAAARYCRDADATVTAAAAPPEASAASAPPPVPAVTLVPAATTETVQVRSPARVRLGPGGGAEVLRIAAQGEVLNVFGRAPGGWLQLGDAAPQGWVHDSLLTAAR